ncbi:MAG: hypothetical protein K2Q23_00575 [Bryobacteraceae bacterium]|nr:hypothetical protein [Bryobacteraceae bacterium]
MHRKVIIGALAVFVILLAIGGLMRRREKQPERIYPALAILIPPNAETVAGIHIERIKKTPIWQRLITNQKNDLLDRFARQTGLDPREDLYEIIAVSTGGPPVFLAAGRFAKGGSGAAGMEPPVSLGGDRVVRSAYRGYTLIGNEIASICFINTVTAVAGPTPEVKAILDRQLANPQPAQAILDRVRAIPLENQIWAFSTARLDRLLPEIPLGAGKIRSLPLNVEYLELTANLALGIDLKIEARNATPQAADQLATAIRGVIGIGRLSTPDDQKDLHRFYDSVRATQDGPIVRVRADAPLDLILALLDRFTRRA